jgi:DNA-binding beta-propeller fold protein YncE
MAMAWSTFLDIEFVIDAALNYGCGAVNSGTSSVTSAAFTITAAKAVDAEGNMYTIDAREKRIRKRSPDGTLSTVVVVGLERPTGVSVDSAGNLYVTDTGGYRIFKLFSGTITTVGDRR